MHGLAMDICICAAYIFLKLPNTVSVIPLGIASLKGEAVGSIKLL